MTIRLMAEVEATFAVAVVRDGEGWADAEQRERDREAAALAEAEEEGVAELVDDASVGDAEEGSETA